MGDGGWEKNLLWEVGLDGELLGDTFFWDGFFVARKKIPFTFKYQEHVYLIGRNLKKDGFFW